MTGADNQPYDNLPPTADTGTRCGKPLHKACNCVRPTNHDGLCNCAYPSGRPYVRSHPLDIWLLDLVEGELSGDLLRQVEQHLKTCGMCRLKRLRLMEASPNDGSER